MSVDSINCLISDVTKSFDLGTMELARVVHEKTDGNAFFAIQFLKMLQDEVMLFWSSRTYSWEWNIDRIMGDTSLSDNVAGIVAHKIGKLSKWAAELLSVAACFGSYFHFDFVVAAIKKDPKLDCSPEVIEHHLAEALETVVSEGLVTRREGSSKCLFVHDKVQQGAYALITDEIEHHKLHLRIGYLLQSLYRDSTSGEEWMFLVFTDQLNRGSSLIVDEQERIDLAQHNLDAALLVMGQSAFFQASKYLEAGLELVGGVHGWYEHYNLTLDLYSTIAECSVCIGDIEKCEESCDAVLRMARFTEDKQRVCIVRIDSWGAQGRLTDTIKFGFEVFRQTGERFPRRPSVVHILLYLQRAKRLLRGKTDKDILSLPLMTNKKKLLAFEVISMLVPMFVGQNRELELGLVALWVINCTVKHGLGVHSGRAFGLYGSILGRQFNFDEASRFCKLCRDLSNRFPNTWEPQAIIGRCYFLEHLRRPLQQQLDPLLKGYQYGMECGDVHHACLSASVYCVLYFYTGLPLGPLLEETEACAIQFERYNQAIALPLLQIIRQVALNITGQSSNRAKLTGTAFDQYEFLKGQNPRFSVRFLWETLIQTAFYFEDDVAAGEACLKIGVKADGTAFRMPSVFMFCALTAMRNWSTRGERRKFRRLARIYLKELSRWAEKGALNVMHKLLLVQAQNEAVKKGRSTDEVLSLFGKAISASRKAGFTHDAALANELAGKYCLGQNKSLQAHHYFAEAIELYRSWGAQAKVDQMMEKYVFLASTELHRQSAFSSFRGLSRMSITQASGHTRFDPFQCGM